MTKSKSKIWGIYEIRNLVNNKVYIGSSINVKARLYEHSRLLNIGKHENNEFKIKELTVKLEKLILRP